jgi:hypothetical protein
VEGPASTDDSVLSSLASRVVREAENLYIPGVNRRDSADDVFAWSVQTQFPSDRLFGTRIFPSTGWFERPDMIKRPVKCSASACSTRLKHCHPLLVPSDGRTAY